MHIHPNENTNIHTFIDLLIDMFLHEYSLTLITITSSVFIYCLSSQLRLFFFSLMFVPFFFLCFFRFPSFFSCFRDRLSRSFYTLSIIVYILSNLVRFHFYYNFSQGHSTPVAAAEMAVNCRAKRLVLNHIGSQFLPMKPNYSKKMDVRSDWELFDQVNIYNYLRNFCFHFSKFNTYHTTLNCLHDLFWISTILFITST